MATAIERLRNLLVKEVSLVDDGDNPLARFSLWKRLVRKRPKPTDEDLDELEDDGDFRGSIPSHEERDEFGKAFHIPGQASGPEDCPPGWRFVASRKVCVRISDVQRTRKQQPGTGDVHVDSTGRDRARRRPRRGRGALDGSNHVAKLTVQTEEQTSGGRSPHPHALILPDGALSSGTFRTEEAQDHRHEAVLTQDLEPGESVTIETSPAIPEPPPGVEQHTHAATITASEEVAMQSGHEGQGGGGRRRRRRRGPRSRSRPGSVPTGRQLLQQRREDLLGRLAGAFYKWAEIDSPNEELEQLLEDELEDFTNPPADAASANEEVVMDLSKLTDEDREKVEAALEEAGSVEKFAKNFGNLAEMITKGAATAAELAKIKKDDEDEDPLEGVPEEVRKIVEPQLKAAGERTTAVEKENTTLKGRLDKLEKDAERVEFAKGIGDLTGLPEKRDDMIDTLWAMPDAETRGKLQKTLEAAAAAARRGDIYGELGSGHDAGGSAYSKIEAVAAEIRKANPKLTEAESKAQAMDQNPELYDAVLEENAVN